MNSNIQELKTIDENLAKLKKLSEDIVGTMASGFYVDIRFAGERAPIQALQFSGVSGQIPEFLESAIKGLLARKQYYLTAAVKEYQEIARYLESEPSIDPAVL